MNQKAFLVGTNRFSFRAGEPAEILGVEFFTPKGLNPRPCYRIRFRDGEEDFSPLSECRRFEIISEEDVKAGKIPAVKY